MRHPLPSPSLSLARRRVFLRSTLASESTAPDHARLGAGNHDARADRRHEWRNLSTIARKRHHWTNATMLRPSMSPSLRCDHSVTSTVEDQSLPQFSHRKISSIGFSGAGFLGCYHLGVSSCFLKHGLLLKKGELPDDNKPQPILLGASAGAITAAAVSAGVHPEDGMNVVYHLRECVRTSGSNDNKPGASLWSALPLDVFRPGFSLVDQVAQAMKPHFYEALEGGDDELFLRRTRQGKGLRIALTDRDEFLKNPNHDFSPRKTRTPPSPDLTNNGSSPHPVEHIKYHLNEIQSNVKPIAAFAKARAQQVVESVQKRSRQNGRTDASEATVNNWSTTMPEAYCYIDQYRSIDDAIHACIVSSFIPGVTGPVKGVSDPSNTAVRDATTSLKELVRLGAVKHGPSGRQWTPHSIRKGLKSTKAGITGEKSAKEKAGHGGTETTGSVIDAEDWPVPEEPFWDGGLSCIWPMMDDTTVIVCPIRANYSPNPAVHPVTPLPPLDDGNASNPFASPLTLLSSIFPKEIPFHGKLVEIGLDNIETLLRMAISSDESILEERYQCGYNDAKRFLKEHNLLSVHQ